MLFVFNLLLFFLYLTCEQTLGVLSQDGLMRFINIQTCKLLFHLGSRDSSISTVAISPNGRYMAAIMDNGRINVYSIHSLTQTFNKVILSTTANSLYSFNLYLGNGIMSVHVLNVCSSALLPGSSSLWW